MSHDHEHTHTNTHKHFTALFPGPPRWAGARRELLDFMVQGKINRGRHTGYPAGCHCIRIKQCPPPPSPNFFVQARCPSYYQTNSVKALKAASAFLLGRRCNSSPQRCYLHCLHTVSRSCTINNLILFLPFLIQLQLEMHWKGTGQLLVGR